MDEVGYLVPRNKFFLASAQITGLVGYNARSTHEIANSLARIDERLESHEPKKDNVAALYAGALDTSGDVVDRTYVGRWICKAGYPSLRSIVQPGGRNRDKRRELFIVRMREAAGEWGRGLPSLMTDAEIGRFFDVAPAVLASIEESQAERAIVVDKPVVDEPDKAEDLVAVATAAQDEKLAEALKPVAVEQAEPVDAKPPLERDQKGDTPGKKK
jgi:hypothetical protein